MPIINTSINIKGIASVLSLARHQVPLHQRSFEWTEQVNEFLDDVGGAFGRNKEEYFLGSLVVISKPEDKRITVLDGQQRLAVISLLIAAIADQFKDKGEEESSKEISREYLTKYNISEKTWRPQLSLNQIDDTYFRSIITRGANEPEQGAPASHARLWEANKSVADWLSKKLESQADSVNWLVEFTEYLKNAAYVIYFTVPDDANAFLIFETMNDRGLDLSISDLLKNFLLGRAGEDLETVLNHWNTSIATLNAYGKDKLFTVFIRHFWNSKYGLVREKDLYRNIRSRISSSANVVDFSQELASNSNYYAAILSPEHEFWSDASPKARSYIGTLSFLGLEQYRPMLLSALAHLQMKDVEKLMKLLISWSVRLLIVGGLGGGVIETNYCLLGQAIRSGELKSVKEMANRAKLFVPNDEMFRNSSATARVSKANLARYYLRTLELQAKGESQPELVPSTDSEALTLEHILPERPEANTWSHFNDDEKKAYTNRLGNMALLKQKMNSAIRSGQFSAKRGVYATSDLLLTKEIAGYDEWNKETIDIRQNRLAELAVEAWNIKP